MRAFLPASAFAALAATAAAAIAQDGRARESVFDQLKPSVVTVEVFPRAGEAKSTLGSGYAVARGRFVTNYHVVGSYIRHPDRHAIRLKTPAGTVPATLLAFDLINDLALLEAPLAVPPLALAAEPGRPGAPLIAFGNPEGLGLSLVEGVFNGFAEKGFVDRMLLSMPLNSGMSGGPILDGRHQVVGTNVSVAWQSNSLSFGVPVTAVHALLAATAVTEGGKELDGETNRQLTALDRRALARAVEPFEAGARSPVPVGGAQMPRPPDAFECWNQTRQEAREQVRKTTFQCHLQFTPALEEVGEVGSLEVLVEHFKTRGNAFGFYGGLRQHGPQHHGVEPRAPDNGVLSPPECHNDRTRSGYLVWRATTCSYAYVRHPGFGYFALVATSISRPDEAVYVAVHGRGVGAETFLRLSRILLQEIRFAEPAS
jgi:hypothetical protein